MNRESAEIITEILDVLAYLGKLRKNAGSYKRSILVPMIKEVDELLDPSEVFRAYLKLINRFITVRISEMVSDVAIDRSYVNIQETKEYIEIIRKRIRLKELYEELRCVVYSSRK